MAKSLCKMNRKQIAENLGEIHRLVSDSKYVCRSCARSSSVKDTLCKPAAIPPQACQNQPIAQQKSCALLAEALPKHQQNAAEQNKAQAVRRVVERVKQKAAQPPAGLEVRQPEVTLPMTDDLADKQAIKRAKKALKKYCKQQKKRLKLAKKQQKLLKQQQKLEADMPNQIALVTTVTDSVNMHSGSNIH